MAEDPEPPAAEHVHILVPTFIGLDQDTMFFFVRYVCLADDCDHAYLTSVEAEEA